MFTNVNFISAGVFFLCISYYNFDELKILTTNRGVCGDSVPLCEL